MKKYENKKTETKSIIVTLQNVSMEKYGRVLADVYLGSLNVNQWMLEGGYVVKYDGGTKHRLNEWEK